MGSDGNSHFYPFSGAILWRPLQWGMLARNTGAQTLSQVHSVGDEFERQTGLKDLNKVTTTLSLAFMLLLTIPCFPASLWRWRWPTRKKRERQTHLLVMGKESIACFYQLYPHQSIIMSLFNSLRIILMEQCLVIGWMLSPPLQQLFRHYVASVRG